MGLLHNKVATALLMHSTLRLPGEGSLSFKCEGLLFICLVISHCSTTSPKNDHCSAQLI